MPGRRRPETTLAEYVKSVTKAPIDKQLISFKGVEAKELDLAPMKPTDEQLAKINQFTRSKKTADQVVVVPTLACNDMIDRDDDRFRKEMITGLSKMKPPYSPIGKSYMVSHDTRTLPVGRIFDAKDVEIDGVTFAKMFAYIPNIDANKSFIENLDYGVYWAVSVGLSFDQAYCMVGEEHKWGWAPWWCSKGHEKGFRYDPESDEKDAWGWPLPTDDDKFPKTIREFGECKDFYELSQVYLGAQYFAELAEKDPDFQGIVKAASARPVPIIGLRREEAKAAKLFVGNDEKLERALRRNVVKVDDDGYMSWTDEEGLAWMHADGETLCLGMSKEKEEVSDAEAVDANSGTEGGGREGSGGQGNDDEGTAGQDDGQLQGDEGAAEGKSLVSEEDEDMDQDQVLALARAAGFDEQDLSAFKVQDGEKPLTALLKLAAGSVKTLQERCADLSKKAELGDTYIKRVKADAIHNFVLANQEIGGEETTPVDTAAFERLLDKAGDDIELVEMLSERERKAAQARFPQSVRRSSFPAEPPEAKVQPDKPPFDASIASRIHGGREEAK